METVVAIIAISVDNATILSGVTNINLKENKKTSHGCIEMLSNLDFEQYVTQTTRKGKKIIMFYPIYH